MSRSHEAGALHAGAGHRSPEWLRSPENPNALVTSLWPHNVTKGANGVLTVAGVEVTKLAEEFGTPAYVVDEDDFRGRCQAFRAGFDGWDVYYAGKAFLCGAVARWVAEEGLRLDVCTGGELAVALRAGFPPERIAFHGNNKSEAELARALDAGVARIVVDSHDEITRLAKLAADRGVRAPVLVRVTVGVEAHTHEYIATAHEDQKFGFSLADGDAAAAAERVLAEPALELRGLHSHIGSQIFDSSGFEIAARRVVGLHAQIRDRHGVELPELCLGGGFGIAYTTQDDPESPAQLAAELGAIVEHECAAYGVVKPRLSVEPGRAIAGPAVFTLYEAGTVKTVQLDAGASRTYVAVDGGMSDNVRTALYDADYSCTLASRWSDAPPALSRVVGKHCESGDIIVKDEFLPADVHPGDLLAIPATGAYCRSLASTYNHVPRPPVVAVRAGEARLIVRRETEEDLLRLDVW
ncbi:diaminopimelate decarboxylase [Actinopolymorpha pittospori]|uniref:Diaminopimelate decarboxylase n=1 Tax=Actinopolymorpha pittospori TaxID=648752 RepID=A0A927N7E4_9ACTN|nr:diaminopimelate decarboxylase [Actinopolymorpha pittospori]